MYMWGTLSLVMSCVCRKHGKLALASGAPIYHAAIYPAVTYPAKIHPVVRYPAVMYHALILCHDMHCGNVIAPALIFTQRGNSGN